MHIQYGQRRRLGLPAFSAGSEPGAAPTSGNVPHETLQLDAASAQQLAVEAFLYGYPLISDLTAVYGFVAQGLEQLPASPFNTFSHATNLARPEEAFVSINNDTIYSISQLDLGAGPLVLHVPDTAGRYYVLQFIDAWTNNFAYVGRRATGTREGDYLITPPGWYGETPEGMTRISAPTGVVTIVGRFACQGAEDIPAIKALQSQLTVRPLQVSDAGVGSTSKRAGAPQPDARVPEDLRFWEQMRVWMHVFPPSQPEQAYQQRFAALGLLADSSPYVNPSTPLADALRAGLQAGEQRLEQMIKEGSATKTGWAIMPHAFDYNLDFFEIGTINSPEWKITDREQAHRMRAMAAREGLWGNHGYEATYARISQDATGQQLNGAHCYRITFTELPPVEAFWSLTMYDVPNYYLVANPIDRYSIGDRTPGLRYDDNGALTLWLQHDQPDDEAQRANWLPAPAGDFRPLLRLYQPGQAILDGSYVLPPIERVH